MVESSGSKIAGATRYIHDVCDEVVAVARCLQERFAKGKVLPEEYSSGECYTWPTQSPGAKFFETFGCWIKVYTKKPRKYWGCAAYLFDLGGRNTYATKKDEALVLA